MTFRLNYRQFTRLVNWTINYLDKHYSKVAFIEAYHPFTAVLAEVLGAHYRVPAVTGVFHPNYYYADKDIPEGMDELLANYDRRNALYHMNDGCWKSMATHYSESFNKTIIPLPLDACELLYKARKGRHRIFLLADSPISKHTTFTCLMSYAN